jgi:hypothetical protein
MKKFAIVLLLSAGPASAALVILDNAHTDTVVTTGSQANFGSQSFTFTVAGGTAGNASSHDNVAANSPVTGSVALNTISFVEAPTTAITVATPGQLFLKIFSDAGATGAPLAVSTNSIDVLGSTNADATLIDLVWNFGGVSLNSTPTHFIRWSTNSTADNTGLGVGRVAAANFTGAGGFVSTYSGGAATNPTGGALAFDTRFEVNFSTVPEPTTGLMALLGGAALLRRRR